MPVARVILLLQSLDECICLVPAVGRKQWLIMATIMGFSQGFAVLYTGFWSALPKPSEYDMLVTLMHCIAFMIENEQTWMQAWHTLYVHHA